jgi:hypothetical protein
MKRFNRSESVLKIGEGIALPKGQAQKQTDRLGAAPNDGAHRRAQIPPNA